MSHLHMTSYHIENSNTDTNYLRAYVLIYVIFILVCTILKIKHTKTRIKYDKDLSFLFSCIEAGRPALKIPSKIYLKYLRQLTTMTTSYQLALYLYLEQRKCVFKSCSFEHFLS